MTYNRPIKMPVVVSSVTLMIVWSLQLLQCVPVVGTDRPGTPAVVAVHSAWADGPSTELQMPNNQIPVDLSGTVKGSADVATIGFYPVLTTGSPLSVGQIEHTIGKPYYLYVDGRDYHRETDTGHPEYSTDHGSNVNPRWNRYHRGGYRRLKKYRIPVVLEMDEDVDYDKVNTDGGDDVVSDKSTESTGWYGELPKHDMPGYGDHHHRIRSIGHAVNVNRLTTVKILVATLKAIMVMKIILLLAAKFKLLFLFKLHLFAKVFALAQTMKLLTIISNPWPLLATVMSTIIANILNTVTAANAASAGNVIGTAVTAFCRSTLTSNSLVDGARVGRMIAVATSVVSTWTNRFLSYLVDYIRSHSSQHLKKYLAINQKNINKRMIKMKRIFR